MKFGDEGLGLKGRDVTVARIISRLTPAPLINLYVGSIMVFTSPVALGPILTPWTALLLCIIFMVILPVTPIIIEAWRGNIDLDVSLQEMRSRFFVFAIVCYLLAILIFIIFECLIMYVLAAAYFGVTTGVMIANYRTKVSVHAAGVGGPGTALFMVYGIVALPVVAVWIAVVWARTVLHQHSTHQSIVGLFIGIIITFLVYGVLYAQILV
ncbi:MAG: hypothetical protein RTU30_14970 [Candidatus Thorarchaeota archaeon]